MSKLALTPNGAGTGTYTLASPNNNASHTLTLPAVTGTLLTSAGDGSALTSLTSGNLTGALPAIDGSALTSLTSNNLTGALPAIDGSALTGLSAGALVFISSTTLASDATAEFTGFNSALYDSYEFVLSNLKSSMNGVTLTLRTSSNGGTSYDSASQNYKTGTSNSSRISFASSTGTNSVTEAGLCGTVVMMSPHLSIHTLALASWGVSDSTTDINSGADAGTRREAAAVDAVQFKPAGGVFASGTITMYGKVKS